MAQDEQHLRILSIMHYVYAGLLALLSLVGLIYVFAGGVFLVAPSPPRGQPPPPAALAWMFIAIGGAITIFGWIIAALIGFAGWSLGQQKRWLFCLVIACVDCVTGVLGIVLGVFTIIVLVRPSVKEMFQAVPARLVDQPPETPHYRPDDPSYRQR
jgi:hypothetical protein